MTLHAGLTYSIIVQSFSLIPLTVFEFTPVETEYDNNNNNNKKEKMKIAIMNVRLYLGGYLCKFNHTSGKHAYRQWLLGGGDKGRF